MNLESPFLLDALEKRRIQAAQTVANAGAGAVISGHMGPNAYQTLQAAGVKVYTVAEGSVRSAAAAFKAGELQETGSPTVGGHFGRGGGRS